MIATKGRTERTKNDRTIRTSIALDMIGPIPGTVITLRQLSLLVATVSISSVTVSIRSSSRRQSSARSATMCKIKPQSVEGVAKQLWELGCYEVSLHDTIGVGTPLGAKAMLRAVASSVLVANLAMHCHDTYGLALANLYAGMEEAVRVIDSAAGGLGGCPFAPGATGNVATEDVVCMLEGMGIATGVDMATLLEPPARPPAGQPRGVGVEKKRRVADSEQDGRLFYSPFAALHLPRLVPSPDHACCVSPQPLLL
jgi:hypothetical protein